MILTEQQDPMYQELAHALALMIYARCCAFEDERAAEYEHYNENRLDVAPDILARLGVMRTPLVDQWMWPASHVFENEWSPAKPVHLKRHAGEPSVFDLIVAVCFLVDWNQLIVLQLQELETPSLARLPILDLYDHRRFRSEPQIVFEYLAFQRAANCLARLGLGEWNDDGQFGLLNEIAGDNAMALANTYSTTRHLTAKRLGGVEFLFPGEGLQHNRRSCH